MDTSTQQTFVLVLTTLPAAHDPEPLARTLVEERLAACVNVLPVMRSVYRWQGVVESADERQLIVKSSTVRLAELQARIAALHPYEVPEMLVVPVADGAPSYMAWIAEATTPRRT